MRIPLKIMMYLNLILLTDSIKTLEIVVLFWKLIALFFGTHTNITICNNNILIIIYYINILQNLISIIN